MNEPDASTEDGVVELQTRLAFQEHTIAELNEALVDQQRQIDQLNLALDSLMTRVRELPSGDTNEPDPPPPHY